VSEQIRAGLMVASGGTYIRLLDGRNRAKFFFFNEMSSAETSPEKAGVGGSIPSLATKESTTRSCSSSMLSASTHGMAAVFGTSRNNFRRHRDHISAKPVGRGGDARRPRSANLP
jgi:hypothetical protein